MNRRIIALIGSAVVLAASMRGASPTFGTGDNRITSPDTGFVGFYTSLALDALGNPVVSYLGGNHLKVLHCDDPDCAGTGESITAPDPTNGAGSHTSLALDASGDPIVSYLDFVQGDLKVIHCDDPNCDGLGESITSPDTVGSVGAYSSLALDAVGSPVISYLAGNPYYDLRILHCGNPNCTAGNSIASPDVVGDVGYDTSLALDASGYPVISYHDATNQRVKVMHCNDVNCIGGDESISSPDGDVMINEYNSLALDTSGHPVVSYGTVDLPAGPFRLKLLHCNDANCTGADESITSPVFDTLGVSAYNSLALDASGYPVISYQGTGTLMVLHCNDTNCSGGGESLRTADATAFGQWTSLEFDASGYPVVSYEAVSATAPGLRVLHCGTADCAGKPATPTSSPTGVATSTFTRTPTSTATASLVSTPTPRPVLGGAAAYPDIPSSKGDPPLAPVILAASTVVVALWSVAWRTRRSR